MLECVSRYSIVIDPDESYRTVRACKSIGAPDSTAAATESPGSLPSITRFGMGEKLLG
jgi:hypothetical protein